MTLASFDIGHVSTPTSLLARVQRAPRMALFRSAAALASLHQVARFPVQFFGYSGTFVSYFLVSCFCQNYRSDTYSCLSLPAIHLTHNKDWIEEKNLNMRRARRALLSLWHAKGLSMCEVPKQNANETSLSPSPQRRSKRRWWVLKRQCKYKGLLVDAPLSGRSAFHKFGTTLVRHST